MTLRPCIDCGAPSAGTRCADHEAEARTRRERDRPPRTDEQGRRPWRWRTLSARLRRMVGECERCGSTAGLSVDHLVPTSMGGEVFPPWSGLRVLCRPCHGKVWAEQRRMQTPNRYATGDGLSAEGGGPPAV